MPLDRCPGCPDSRCRSGGSVETLSSCEHPRMPQAWPSRHVFLRNVCKGLEYGIHLACN